MIDVLRHRRTFAAVVLLSLTMFGGAARAASVEGTWIVGDIAVRVFECHDRFCARIVWVKDASRRASQCGRTIVWGLQAEAGDQWAGGSILDPDDNNVYELAADGTPDGTLQVRIFKGARLFGETKVLRRVDTRALDGLC